MDFYNRGYDAGLEGLGGEGEQIGWATIKRDAERLLGQGEAKAADFYAIAYDVGTDGPEGMAGKTVISYRGTNSELDRSTGWMVGAR